MTGSRPDPLAAGDYIVTDLILDPKSDVTADLGSPGFLSMGLNPCPTFLVADQCCAARFSWCVSLTLILACRVLFVSQLIGTYDQHVGLV